MKRIGAARFKEKCLSILDRLDPDGIVITKRGKPVARLVPIERSGRRLVGSLRDRIRVKGDLESTGLAWDAGG